MASSFEKSVKGATKIKHILVATHTEHGVAEVFRALQNRLRDSTWTVVFKSLITVHLMIREGSPDVTLSYLARHRNMLAISSFSDVQTQGRNIRHYTNYLSERARAYRDTKCDYVRGAEGRLEKMSVEKGILRETETVQHQITALLKCDVLDTEQENEITITVFRMLVLDLLAMFHVMNQAMINILGHFFEMSRPDAERAMEIYKNFTKQTDFVVAYLGTARQYEHQTRVEVPKLKHAPINLGKQLEDYLMDPDFEINRRQYMAEQESKTGRPKNGVTKPSSTAVKNEPMSRAAAGRAFPDAQPSASAQNPTPKAPDADLIDFFDSIEQNHQPAGYSQGQQQQQPPSVFNNGAPLQTQQPVYGQQNGFSAPTNPYQNTNQFQEQQSFNGGFQSPPPQLQPNFTGTGFGGYTPQSSFQPGALSSIPQDAPVSFQQNPQQLGTSQPIDQQTTNPFRQSTMSNPTGVSPPIFAASPPITSPMQRQSTNPFAKSITSPPIQQSFSPPAQDFQQQQQQYPQTAPLPATEFPAEFSRPTTGTNPFARNMSMSSASQRPQTSGGLVPQQTGNTNPFRQSQFVNTATGAGWQNNQQAIGGGLDSLQTVPIFPRPTQQQPWQQ